MGDDAAKTKRSCFLLEHVALDDSFFVSGVGCLAAGWLNEG